MGERQGGSDKTFYKEGAEERGRDTEGPTTMEYPSPSAHRLKALLTLAHSGRMGHRWVVPPAKTGGTRPGENGEPTGCARETAAGTQPGFPHLAVQRLTPTAAKASSTWGPRRPSGERGERHHRGQAPPRRRENPGERMAVSAPGELICLNTQQEGVFRPITVHCLSLSAPIRAIS